MKAGTLLRTIASHSLWLQCRACGHEAQLKVSDLLEQSRPDAAVRDVLPRLKCSKCRSKQIGEFRIISPDVVTEHDRMRTPADQALD